MAEDFTQLVNKIDLSALKAAVKLEYEVKEPEFGEIMDLVITKAPQTLKSLYEELGEEGQYPKISYQQNIDTDADYEDKSGFDFKTFKSENTKEMIKLKKSANVQSVTNIQAWKGFNIESMNSIHPVDSSFVQTSTPADWVVSLLKVKWKNRYPVFVRDLALAFHELGYNSCKNESQYWNDTNNQAAFGKKWCAVFKGDQKPDSALTQYVNCLAGRCSQTEFSSTINNAFKNTTSNVRLVDVEMVRNLLNQEYGDKISQQDIFIYLWPLYLAAFNSDTKSLGPKNELVPNAVSVDLDTATTVSLKDKSISKNSSLNLGPSDKPPKDFLHGFNSTRDTYFYKSCSEIKPDPFGIVDTAKIKRMMGCNVDVLSKKRAETLTKIGTEIWNQAKNENFGFRLYVLGKIMSKHQIQSDLMKNSCIFQCAQVGLKSDFTPSVIQENGKIFVCSEKTKIELPLNPGIIEVDPSNVHESYGAKDVIIDKRFEYSTSIMLNVLDTIQVANVSTSCNNGGKTQRLTRFKDYIFSFFKQISASDYDDLYM